MRYVASCSFGKDSMATIILALQYGLPLHEVVYCEVMFDDEISAEVPEHRAFIHGRAIPFLKEHGIKVNVIRSEMTFIQSFYRVLKKGKNIGKINSWPLCGKCCIQRDCKLAPIKAFQESLGPDVIQYIGIAYDEPERLERLDRKRQVSLLEKYRLTERDAVKLCKDWGLYSLVYQFTKRNGCFFCPNSKMQELRHLYDYHPDLWMRLLECQKAPNKATEKFNRNYQIDEIDARFRFEDTQLSLFDEMPGMNVA